MTCMTNIIEEQQSNLSNYAPPIPITDMSITLQLRESVYEKMDALLKQTSKLMLDELRQEGEPIQFQDILERDKQWKCISCQAIHSKEVIFCEKCSMFRPLEMFKNLVHQPQKVSEFELYCLDQRRKMEK